MKTVQVRKNILLITGALSFISILLTGCLKDVSNSTSTPKTYISVMHLAPRAPAVEIYFNSTKESSPINPGVVSSTYSPVDPSAFAVNFKKAGSDSLVANIPTDIYDSLRFYTLLLYNIDSTHVNAVKIEDDFSVLTMDKAYFRFFHMSPDVGNVDVYFDNDVVSSGRSYADNTTSNYYNQFSPTTANSYNIYVKKAGTDSVIAEANSVPLGASGAYTIFLKGINNGTGLNQIGVSVLQASE
jgi:hypothetical protein